MAGKYSGVGVTPKSTPQSQPIPGYEKVMSKNSAGGYTFDITCFKRLERFLILGSDSNTYYASAQKLSTENYESLNKCLAQDYKQTIDLIVDVSHNGRASSNDPALFALAVCASSKDCNVVRYAMSKLPLVARIGTHLFTFVQYVKERRSFGRAVRKGLSDWYLTKSPVDVSYQMAKYQSRNGMSHGDVFRLSHLNAGGSEINPLVRWALGKGDAGVLFGMVECLEHMNEAKSKDQVINLINLYNAPREVVPTEFLKDPDVWKAMLPSMGLEAIVRNLGNMSNYGVFADKDALSFVTGKLNDKEVVRKARLHPIKSLVGMMQYNQGHGNKGTNTWPVNRLVSQSVENAFYNGFASVESTGKNIYYGVDVSGSMGYYGGVCGIEKLTARMCAAALTMVLAESEKNYIIRGFSHKLVDIPIYPGMRLEKVMDVMSSIPYGATDCSLPVQDALDRNLDVDLFVNITDNETWYGQSHVSQLLDRYRNRVGHRVKFVTVALTATNSSINNQDDLDSLDAVGMDSNLPAIINNL
jgi:60 kDa SS-A/Ro ribonucleoprotein